MPIGHMVEEIYKLFAPYGMKVPQLTPSRIRLLSLSRTFDCSKANDLIGYTPIVPLQVCTSPSMGQFSIPSFSYESKRKEKRNMYIQEIKDL